MAKNPETALAKLEVSKFPVLTTNIDELKSVISDNVGDDKLSEFDLKRYIVPSGGGNAFNVDGPEGADTVKEIVGIIVFKADRRSYWIKKFGAGEASPPDCQSVDLINGYGSEAAKCGGKCAACPMSQFGSAVDSAGNPARGQACSQKKTLLILEADQVLPSVLTLPPTSLGGWKSFMAKLISARVPFHSIVTKITLAPAANKGGTKYSEAKFELVQKIDDPALAAKFKGLGEAFGEMFRAQIPDELKEQNTPPGTQTVVDVTTGETDAEGNTKVV